MSVSTLFQMDNAAAIHGAWPDAMLHSLNGGDKSMQLRFTMPIVVISMELFIELRRGLGGLLGW